MNQPQKWRDTIDPFSIKYKTFELTKVLGYPHAGNDVFYAKGINNNKEIYVFIKVARQLGADIQNEVQILKQIPFSHRPEIIEYSFELPQYIITREAEGKRLSMILGDNENLESLDYMKTYGRTLAELHQIDIQCNPVKYRRFFDIPSHEYFQHNCLEQAEVFLNTHTPKKKSYCFVHGDFHYANLLWLDKKLNCVLDYELAGIGIREFDMAWAVFLRPGQNFLKSAAERDLFLEGYKSHSEFDRSAFNYYLILTACHFYPMGDESYRLGVRNIIREIMDDSLSII